MRLCQSVDVRRPGQELAVGGICKLVVEDPQGVECTTPVRCVCEDGVTELCDVLCAHFQ